MTSLAACLLVVSLGAGPVAHLRLATNDVKVWRGKASVPAAKDLPLSRTDEVDVPVGGVALVQIAGNGQVVRIDEDLRLAVSDLAALDAPKTSVGLRDQLDALLTPAERQARGSQRMVGWFVAPVAAQVRTGSGLKLMDDEESKVAPETEPVQDEVEQKKPPIPEKREAPPSLGGKGTGPGGGGHGEGGGGPKDKLVSGEGVQRPANQPASAVPSPKPAEPPATGGPMLPSPPPAPPTLMPPDEATRACLRAAVAALGEKAAKRLGDKVTVKLRRSGDHVVVFIQGAVPVDACVQAWADRQLAALPASGWAPLQVPLK